jgi:hypothetical protein
MSEHEEQEGVFKVTDRRLFNPDGSTRDGVVIEKAPEKPAPEPVAETPAEEVKAEAEAVREIQSEPTTPEAFEIAEAAEDGIEGDEYLDDGEEIPGEQDPASFVNFMMSLASQAAAALGAMPHPVTGQRTLDLDLAKHWIDTLAMLKDKTVNNLHPKEEQLMNGLLSDLRMQYIQLSQAAEERLKQQAAQKFSSKDVLGGGR